MHWNDESPPLREANAIQVEDKPRLNSSTHTHSIPETPDTMGEAAMEYSRTGWNIHPCIPAGPKAKAPYLPHGFKQASADADVIRKWWQQWPNALIGLAIPPHLIVLDIDPRHGGSMAILADALGLATMPRTLAVISGRDDGGLHLYYRNPNYGRTDAPRFKPEPAPGVDMREGGKHYVIAPPSLHPETGKPYRWITYPIAELPASAAARLRVPKPKQQPATLPRFNNAGRTEKTNTVINTMIRECAALQPGQRDCELFSKLRRAQSLGATPVELQAMADAIPKDHSFTEWKAGDMVRRALAESMDI